MGALVESVHRVHDAESERRLVQRVTASDLFQRSPRLRELLLYVAECTLEKRLTEVREQVIAEKVFGRKPDSGGQDSIVRAEARNLRKRLELYFQTEGRDEPVIIVMPKGRYSLAFPLRLQEDLIALSPEQKIEAALITAAPLIEPSPIPVTAPYSAERLSAGFRHYQFLALGLAVIALVASGLALYWFGQHSQLQKRLAIDVPVLPLSAIFSDDQEALIVTSDVGVLQISSLLHRRITLDEYIARSYPAVAQTNPPNLIQNWNVYEFTDGRETTVAGLILKHNAQFASRILLRSGHAIQLQDFKDHNVVLIGSPISNPWAQLYEDRLNFRCELAADGFIVFRKASAGSNQQQQFPNDDDVQHHRTYARIAFLPKTSDAGAALLVAGTTAQSTQAAGELVVDQPAFSRILRSAGIDPQGPPEFFEILIRSSNFVAGAISTEVVAFQRSSPPER